MYSKDVKMKPIKFMIFLIIISMLTNITYSQNRKKISDYVNPFIGTNEMGHCYPGATVPFGMVQLSPETDSVSFFLENGSYNPEVYNYCAGYQYQDKTITGFSHTHFSGTGHSDLGDFLIMPTTGSLQLKPGAEENPESGYRSRFSHQQETASPGYYAVFLKDYRIQAELTATCRAGFHKYTFPRTDSTHIILDMTAGIYDYDGKVVWSSLRMENDTLVTGYRQTNGWARTRFVYFAMAFSKPVENYGFINQEKLKYTGFWRKWDQDDNFPQRAGAKLKAFFDFKTQEEEVIKIKIALSSVSTAGALKNLKKEIPHWDFEKIKNQAKALWEKELNKIHITASEKTKEIFYTALYHTFLSPIEYMDVDGKYRGIDKNIHTAGDFTNYTIFSLWDTYRALHPLFTILQTERTNDIIRSMLAHYDQSVHHILPIWSHYANENWCMIGYHSVPVIVDAYMKNIRDYSVNKAFEAVLSSSNYDQYDGIGFYKKLGYVPYDRNSNSASKTLEYAYDDWTISVFADSLGEKKTGEQYRKRALSYQNLFDAESGFIRPKHTEGSWKSDFNPLETTGQGFIEGNAWNYSLYIPHDIQGFITLLGSEKKLEKWLDTLFTMQLSEESYAYSEDIQKSGIMGNYVHGNEPSHHIPYLYNWTDSPWKTQEKVRLIMDTMYDNTTDGISGNDDCGQMSAWYIFSSIGLYPVCPGSNQYTIGSPCVEKAKVMLENGKIFTVRVKNCSPENRYIKSVILNGKNYNKTYITHQDIISGSTLEFIMNKNPERNWGTAKPSQPFSLSE